jgi:branched-chain amino acid transport system ATP-binding protein
MIKVDNIKKYFGGFCAVDGASLDIKKGSITGSDWSKWSRKNYPI